MNKISSSNYMSRKRQIILIVLITVLIIGAGVGGFALWSFWPADWSRDAPTLEFPVENTNVIHILGGYGNTPYGFWHNGIDFGCNDSVNILAPCNLRLIGIKTWMYATDPDRWQTSVRFTINWAYSLEIAFESWALNETFADIQREAITLKVNQIVAQGEMLGELLYHGDGTHIHFMIRYKGDAVCPYNFFSESAKNLFDSLWVTCGVGGIPCNETIT